MYADVPIALPLAGSLIFSGICSLIVSRA
jgi:hypothetical protein